MPGTKDDPWELATPAGGSAFQAWRDLADAASGC